MAEPRSRARAWAAALLLASAACVSLDKSGEHVSLLEPTKVGPACQKIGIVSSRTLSKILFIPRSPERIARELSIVARNQAGDLGGDTIAPSTPVEGGKQKFDLYRCSQS